jgi:hypothetical protein
VGWSIGYDDNWSRDIGYGVPCKCDHPDCDADIDRGLAHVCCGQQPYGGEDGCGLYFCGAHLVHYRDDDGAWSPAMCERCAKDEAPFSAKPDAAEWIKYKLTCETWQQWRDENPTEAVALRKSTTTI